MIFRDAYWLIERVVFDINSDFSMNIKIKISFIVIITAVIVLIIGFVGNLLFLNGYIMKNSHKTAEIVYENTVSNVRKDSFDVANDDPYFSQEKLNLQDIRIISGVSGLYTIAYSEDKNPVYVISSFKNAERDTVKTGENIDESTAKYAFQALAGNAVRVGNIKINDEKVVLFMYPVYDADGETVIGALGIEFDLSVTNYYADKSGIIYLSVLSIVIIIVVASLIMLFWTIINKVTSELAYTDNFTMLKNRQAFEKYLTILNDKISNNIGTDFKIFVIVFDINDLSIVNDTFGNDSGDKYIKAIVSAINESFRSTGKIYRVSGDEFDVIAENCTEEQLKLCLDNYEAAEKQKDSEIAEFAVSASYGYSGFINGSDADMAGVIKRANERMKRKKKEKKNKSMRLPR